jgi:hypothetical protein
MPTGMTLNLLCKWRIASCLHDQVVDRPFFLGRGCAGICDNLNANQGQ